MQTTEDFAGSTDMWSTSAGGHLMKVVNLTGFTVLDLRICIQCVCISFHTHIHTLGELQKKRGPEPRTDYPQLFKTLSYKTTMNVKYKMICHTYNNWSLRQCQ